MGKFSNASAPLLTALIDVEGKLDGAIATIKKTINQGAEAICFTMNALEPQHKCDADMKAILDAMDGRPSYIANYVWGTQPELTDDDLAEGLLRVAKLGADLIDIRGDMFCRTHGEMTRDQHAVQKQKELISELHKMGKEVLMSTHITEYKSPENILEIAMLQKERGVDIAKIVTFANSEKESDDAFRTNLLLKEKLNLPFLFLCSGASCRKHRLLSPVFGSCMYLCLENSNLKGPQPTIAEAKAIKETFLSKDGNFAL